MKKFIKYFVSVSLLLPVFSVKAAVLDVNVQCDDPAATNYMVITGINDTAFNAGSALDCVMGFRGNLEGDNETQDEFLVANPDAEFVEKNIGGTTDSGFIDSYTTTSLTISQSFWQTIDPIWEKVYVGFKWGLQSVEDNSFVYLIDYGTTLIQFAFNNESDKGSDGIGLSHVNL